MDNRLKRFLSLALAMVMVIGMMPANVVFATENEGGGDEPAVVADPPHEHNFTDVVTTAPTYTTPGVKTPTCSCEATGTPVKICATGCMATAAHETCVIKCNKKTECTLVYGHTDVCMNGETVLVDVSDVFSEKGLVAAISTGGNIKLTDDIALTAALTISNTVTLDLNGNSITLAAPAEGQTAPDYALINEGTLTITGSGTIAGIRNKGSLTTQGGAFVATKNNTYAVWNEGTANIKGGTFNVSGGNYALYNDSAKTMTISGATVAGVYNASGILTVSGGTINGSGAHAVHSLGGSLTVSGGEFHNNTTGVATVKVGDTCETAITGGTITNEADAPALAVETTGEYDVTISDDAVIKSGIAVADGAVLTVEGGTFQDADADNFSVGGKVTVKGGTYEDQNAQNFAKLHAAEKKILKFKVGGEDVLKVRSAVGEVSDVVATIDTGATVNGYPTLQAAVDDAAVNAEVKMIKDVAVGDTLLISADQKIILNMNGCAITAAMAEEVIQVKVGGSLTINGNGSVTNTVVYGEAIYNYGTLVINSGTFTGDYALFNGSHHVDTAIATLNGGTFNTNGADAYAYYAVANCGRMTVAGATVNDYLSTSGVFSMTSGKVEYLVACGAEINPASGISTSIKGGEITSLETNDYLGNLYKNVVTIEAGSTASGKTLPKVGSVWAGKQEGAAITSQIYIKDGVFGDVGTYLFNSSYEVVADSSVSNAMFISGGTFDIEPAAKYIVTGYESVETPVEGKTVYVVQLKKVDLQEPTGDTLNNLITNNGADATVTRDQVLNDIKNNENFNEDVVNDTDYTLVIVPQEVVIEAGDPYKTSMIIYSVTPVDAEGNTTSNPGKKIKFNLPIPGSKPDYITHVNVYHEGELMGEFPIEGTEGNWYVTVESAEFSKFAVELIDIDFKNHVARIGVKGYASVQAAVNAVKDGETIQLMALPPKKVYGPVDINLSADKSFTIDGTVTGDATKTHRTWYYDGSDATIEITGTSPAGKKVTIKNIEFIRVNKDTGVFIEITGNNSGSNNVEIQNCKFIGSGSSSGMAAINLVKTNGVVVNGGTGSNLQAFLKNEEGKNLTVKNVSITETSVGMELGAIQGVNLEGVNITGTTGKYGISMDGSVNNNAVFKNCSITAYLPIMVYNTTANGKIAFEGTNAMNGTVGNGSYWMVLGDDKYSDKAEGTDPKTLKTTGRIVITVKDTALDGEGINYKHKDVSNDAERKYYTVMPEGVLESVVVFDDRGTKGDSRVSFEIKNLKANESIVLEIYENGTKIAESKLVNKDVLYNTALTGYVSIAKAAGSWQTTWHTDEKCATYRNVPDTAKLIVDGKPLDEVPVELNEQGTSADQMRVWTDFEGVGNVTLVTKGKETWHNTLAEAFNTVADKGTGKVTLFADNKAVLSSASEVTSGKTITVTGEGTLDWTKGWMYIGRGDNSSGNGTLIFDNAKIHAFGGGDATGFNVSGAKEGAANVGDGVLEIVNGSDITVDFFLSRNYVLVDDAKLTIKHGFVVGGRPASEVVGDEDATATMEVLNGAELHIGNTVETTLGYEGNGELIVDDAKLVCTSEFVINENNDSEFNVSGTSELNIKKVTGKAINVLDEAVIKNSSVGGAAVVMGTKDKPVSVTFTGTKQFDTITVTEGVVNFTGTNTVGDVTVTGTANVDGKCTVRNLAIAGTLNTNTESLITAKIISVASGDDKIIIDATKLANEKGVKVIDLDGHADSKAVMLANVSVKNNAAAKRVEKDGDVIIYFEAYVDKDKDGAFDKGEGFATIEAAVAAANNGETVVLLADATIEASIAVSKKIVLNLNAHTLSSAATGFSALKVTASGATVKNGKLYAVKSGNVGVEVAKNAAVELVGVEVNGKTAGIKAYGNVTVGKGCIITAQDSNAAIRAYDKAVVTIDGGTVSKENACAIEMNKSAKVTVNSGTVSGAPAFRIYGGDLVVAGGNVTATAGNAIVTCSDANDDVSKTSVTISKGNITGAITAEDVVNSVVPKDYKVSVVITGGSFTKSNLDWDYYNKEYGSIAVSGGTFDKKVSIKMCAVDYLCQKKSGTSLYEVIRSPHGRVYLGSDFAVGSEVHFDGKPYQVQDEHVVILDAAQAKKAQMFMTTYAIETKNTATVEDDYPTAMYVWYVKGNKINNDEVHDIYSAERVSALDNFFEYNGTSIRVGATTNGIRFFSSINTADAEKMINGTLITSGSLAGSKMVGAGTVFKKNVDYVNLENGVSSYVFGGAVGNSFRVFQQANGRNWFTGVLTGLENAGKIVVEPIATRPYAEINVGGNTVVLYGGPLERTIHYVARQNQNTFAAGSSYDNFVENLIKMGG